MGTTADKLDYLRETKEAIKTSLVNKGAEVTEKTPFREYASAIDNLPTADGEETLNTINLTDFSHFFYAGSRWELWGAIDTRNGKNFDSMYAETTIFGTTEVPPINTSNGTNFHNMFAGFYYLQKAPMLDLRKATTVERMFYACRKLKTVPELDFSNVTNFSDLFYSCSDLENLPFIDIIRGTTFSNMFAYCKKLKSVSLSKTSYNFSTSSFSNCLELTNVTIWQGWAASIYLNYSEKLTVESLHGMIENLADLTGLLAKTFQVGSTNLAKIDEEHITMLQNKNWNYS